MTSKFGKSRTTMSHTLPPLKTAEALLVTARAFATGAHAIVKSETRQNYANDVRFIIPCAMLVGHALEVYLKAWLAAHDSRYNSDVLRKQFGHDLRRLYEEARNQGLPEPEAPPQHSFHDLIESYEKDHYDYSFRYLRDGWSFEIPKNDILFGILKRFDGVVATKVGAVVPDNLDWSVNPNEDFRSSAQ